jgi:hypothetical protein
MYDNEIKRHNYANYFIWGKRLNGANDAWPENLINSDTQTVSVVCPYKILYKML